LRLSFLVGRVFGLEHGVEGVQVGGPPGTLGLDPCRRLVERLRVDGKVV
jgi:hypothetical protein